MSYIAVHLKTVQDAYSQGNLRLVRARVTQGEFFLELIVDITNHGHSVWEHGLIFSWEKAGVVPDFTTFSEEELFQYELTNVYSDVYKMKAIQQYILDTLPLQLENYDTHSTWIKY